MDNSNQPLLGFRLWSLEENKLWSIGAGKSYWSPGPNQAVCLRDPEHVAPVADCECGYYAYKSLVAPEAGEYRDILDSSIGLVGGAVAAGGDVLMHPEGFRAEQMAIVALCYIEGDTETWEALQPVAKEFGVPVFDSVEEFSKYTDALPFQSME